MPFGWPLRWPAVVLSADPLPRALAPTGVLIGVNERVHARISSRTQPPVLTSHHLCLVPLKGHPMAPRRVPASQPPADRADPRLSLDFLLNPGGATDNGSALPTPEAAPESATRSPPAHPPLPGANAPRNTVEHEAERGRAAEQGVPQTGEVPHLPLPPPPRRDAPVAPLPVAPLEERGPPTLPLPPLRPPPLPPPPSLLPSAQPTLAGTTTPPARLVPAASQGYGAPPLTTVGTTMAATQGFPSHGVRWNEGTQRFDVMPAETAPTRQGATPSGDTGRDAGVGGQPVWREFPPVAGNTGSGRLPPSTGGAATVLDVARAATRAAAAAAAAATTGGPPWRLQSPLADPLTQGAPPAVARSPGPPFPVGAGGQGTPLLARPVDRHAFGPGVGVPPPPRHPEGLGVPPPATWRGRVPPPDSQGAGAFDAAAAVSGSLMEGVTAAAAAAAATTGTNAGADAPEAATTTAAAGAADADAATRVAAVPGGGATGGGGGAGGGRRRRLSGGRPRVQCPRDGCTATFAQRAGALGETAHHFPTLLFVLLPLPIHLWRGGGAACRGVRGLKGVAGAKVGGRTGGGDAATAPAASPTGPTSRGSPWRWQLQRQLPPPTHSRCVDDDCRAAVIPPV